MKKIIFIIALFVFSSITTFASYCGCVIDNDPDFSGGNTYRTVYEYDYWSNTNGCCDYWYWDAAYGYSGMALRTVTEIFYDGNTNWNTTTYSYVPVSYAVDQCCGGY